MTEESPILYSHMTVSIVRRYGFPRHGREIGTWSSSYVSLCFWRIRWWLKCLFTDLSSETRLSISATNDSWNLWVWLHQRILNPWKVYQFREKIHMKMARLFIYHFDRNIKISIRSLKFILVLGSVKIKFDRGEYMWSIYYYRY